MPRHGHYPDTNGKFSNLERPVSKVPEAPHCGRIESPHMGMPGKTDIATLLLHEPEMGMKIAFPEIKPLFETG